MQRIFSELTYVDGELYLKVITPKRTLFITGDYPKSTFKTRAFEAKHLLMYGRNINYIALRDETNVNVKVVIKSRKDFLKDNAAVLYDRPKSEILRFSALVATIQSLTIVAITAAFSHYSEGADTGTTIASVWAVNMCAFMGFSYQAFARTLHEWKGTGHEMLKSMVPKLTVKGVTYSLGVLLPLLISGNFEMQSLLLNMAAVISIVGIDSTLSSLFEKPLNFYVRQLERSGLYRHWKKVRIPWVGKVNWKDIHTAGFYYFGKFLPSNLAVFFYIFVINAKTLESTSSFVNPASIVQAFSMYLLAIPVVYALLIKVKVMIRNDPRIANPEEAVSDLDARFRAQYNFATMFLEPFDPIFEKLSAKISEKIATLPENQRASIQAQLSKVKESLEKAAEIRDQLTAENLILQINKAAKMLQKASRHLALEAPLGESRLEDKSAESSLLDTECEGAVNATP